MNPRTPSLIAEIFAEQVQVRADRTAVVCGAERLTYRELDILSDRFARRLAARGIGSGDIVGLAVHRSPLAAVAWLGVAKVNAACLWLGLDYPPERLAMMLEDARPALVVATREGRRRVGEAAVGVLPLESAVSDPAELPACEVGPTAPADSASYVLYTSGSTGRPKGVVVTCTGLRSLMETAALRVGAGPDSVIAQFSSLSFDVAFWETVMGLLLGGRLVIVPDDARVPDHAFGGLLREHGVTHAALPPAFLELLPYDAPLPPGLTVLTGADKVPAELMRRWSRRCRMVAAYGVTEATVNSTLWTFDRDWTQPLAPIGIADPGTEIRVLDEALRPVVPGAEGELHLAGDGLARGYLHRPDLTAARFVADPYGPAGTRMYRTGDRVRRDESGVYEFLGRVDAQLKVRGHRIEPGEVESVLLAHAAVRQALVTTRGTELVAFVAGAEATGPGLRAHVAASLPPYMVPNVIIPVESLPTLPSGKVDRRAVPAAEPDQPAAVPADAGSAVRAALAEELGDADGDAVDFVARGGHSLMAMRIVTRLRTELGWAPTVRDLFSAERTADLTAGFRRAVPALEPRREPGPAPLSFEQERLWLLADASDGDSPYVVPWAWRVQGDLDVDVLHAAWSDVIRRHPVLRTRFPLADGAPVQVVDAEPRWSVRFTDDIAAAAAEPFRLAEDLPFRLFVHRIAPREQTVLVCLHHIATDDWSTARLAEDLGDAYARRAAGEKPEPRPLPLDFADVARWQRDTLGEIGAPTARTAEQLDWWSAELAGLPAETSLPSDRPRSADRTGGTTRRHWSAEHSRALIEKARAAGATVYHVMHAALVVALAEQGVGPEVVVGCPVAGRTDPRTHDLVGFFVNTVVLRARVADGMSFPELLRQVRETDLAALAHSDVSFAHVVEALRPPRRPHRNPLFQVMLAQQHHTGVVPRLPHTEVEPVRVAGATAAFDLGLGFVETPDGMTLTAEYRTGLYDGNTVNALLDRVVAVLDAVLADEPVTVRPATAPRPSPAQERATGDAAQERATGDAAQERATAGRSVEPATGDRPEENERLLCEVLAEVLGVPEVGPDDDFFGLGGHSLLAIRFLNAVRARRGSAPSLADLFEHTRVADLARVLPAPAPRQPLPMERAAPPGGAPLSFEQERLWALQILDPDDDAYAVPWAWRVRGPLDLAALRAAWDAVIHCHAVLRTRFPEVDDEPRQHIDPAPRWSPVEHRTTEAALAADLARATTRPFSLEKDLPFRLDVFHLGPDDAVVLLCLHHIVTDDWSVGRLAHDISRAYRGRPLRAPAVAYADHAARQRARLGPAGAPTPHGRDAVAWWREYLRGAPAEVTLPPDRPHASGTGGAAVRRTWNEARAAGIRSLARRAGATPYLVLSAALSAVLAESGAGEDVVLGCPIANRPLTAVEDTVGFFVNTVPLRLRVADGVAFTDLLRTARDGHLAAFARRELSFAHIVEAVNPPRHPDRNPLFQVMFAQEHGTDALPSLPGAEVSAVEPPVTSSPFDLAVAFVERPDGIGITVHYRSARYAPATVEGFLDRWETFVDGMESAVVHPRAVRPADPAPAAPEEAPHRGDTDGEAVLRVFREVLERPDIDPDDDFFEQGGHSLLAVRLIRAILAEAGVQIPLRRFLRAPTPQGVASAVAALRTGRAR
ncbi:amino acid adenylation domain-containing protein [Streptomyces globisporus]